MEKDKLHGVNCHHKKWGGNAVAIWEDHDWPIWEGK